MKSFAELDPRRVLEVKFIVGWALVSCLAIVFVGAPLAALGFLAVATICVAVAVSPFDQHAIPSFWMRQLRDTIVTAAVLAATLATLWCAASVSETAASTVSMFFLPLGVWAIYRSLYESRVVGRYGRDLPPRGVASWYCDVNHEQTLHWWNGYEWTGQTWQVKDAGAVAQPGWYPDPAEPTRWRWWDGASWTNNVSG